MNKKAIILMSCCVMLFLLLMGRYSYTKCSSCSESSGWLEKSNVCEGSSCVRGYLVFNSACCNQCTGEYPLEDACNSEISDTAAEQWRISGTCSGYVEEERCPNVWNGNHVCFNHSVTVSYYSGCDWSGATLQSSYTSTTSRCR